MAGEPLHDFALLAQKIDWIGGLVTDLKASVNRLDERLQAVERGELGCRAQNTAEIREAGRRLDDHEEAISGMGKRLALVEAGQQKLMAAYSVLVFFASIFGVSVIALIWALITGQAEVIFK